jgi:hypothetical protein
VFGRDKTFPTFCSLNPTLIMWVSLALPLEKTTLMSPRL